VSFPRIEHIRSRENPQYKLWCRFLLRPDDPDCPWIPVEGRRQAMEVSRERPPALLLLSREDVPGAAELAGRASRVVVLGDRLLEGASRVRSPQGIIAFFEKPVWTRADLTPFVVFLDRLQDPGNLGAILRTAAATGRFSLVSAPGTVSRFNDKVVRASAGYLFGVPFLEGVPLEDLARLKYRVFVADPGADADYFDEAFEPPLALALGTEGAGIDLPSAVPHRRLRIPMDAGVDSLNVAVAASLLMYEVLRRNR
jgi:RNA methyltransferase, TrmH family